MSPPTALTDINAQRGYRPGTLLDPDRWGIVIGTDGRRIRKGTTITLGISGTF